MTDAAVITHTYTHTCMHACIQNMHTMQAYTHAQHTRAHARTRAMRHHPYTYMITCVGRFYAMNKIDYMQNSYGSAPRTGKRSPPINPGSSTARSSCFPCACEACARVDPKKGFQKKKWGNACKGKSNTVADLGAVTDEVGSLQKEQACAMHIVILALEDRHSGSASIAGPVAESCVHLRVRAHVRAVRRMARTASLRILRVRC
jgi:hypothetical protein